MKKLLILFLMACTVVTSFGCGSSQNTMANLDWTPYQYTSAYIYESEPSNTVTLSQSGVSNILQYISNVEVDYPYSYLYDLEEVKSRLYFDASVQIHQDTALDKSGNLEASHLATLIAKNNEEYLSTEPFGYENVDKQYIEEISVLIVEVVNHMRTLYPDLDWDRIYCNLGNLKILNDVGMLSYAQVNEELVLAISKNNTEIVLRMKDENGFRDVLIHEIMHIIQLGCQCENIDNCKRRAGISIYWDDFTLNTGDWTWLVEGSAERFMCRLTGDEAISYQYKMDYISTFTVATMLQENVKQDTIETLSFDDNSQLLFEIFGCTSQKERDEVLNMMITMNILQMQPGVFYDEVKKHMGFDPRESDDSMNKFSYELKPAVCISLSKEFYQNLTNYVAQNQPTVNDICFLINVFEGHLNQHLKFNNETLKDVNEPFFREYEGIRNAFFNAIEAENYGLDMESTYDNYNIIKYTQNSAYISLNADLTSLSADERSYLTESIKWQDELSGLGIKFSEF